jgi:hypothetical protein
MARSLSRSAQSTVERFSAELGLPGQPNEDGTFGFDFERSGRLSVMAAPEDNSVLVSLTGRLMLEGPLALARLVQQAGYDPLGDRIVQVGLTRAGQGVLVVAIPEQAFDIVALQATFDHLSALQIASEP